jgi:GR25 family glycosyltransferase involved in LPS biosynthesis
MLYNTSQFIVCIAIILVVHLYLDYISEKELQENFDNTKTRFFEKIDEIYYINLEHRADRNELFLSNFSQVDENRIHRINGEYVKENGAVGCLMSHIKALEQALKDSDGVKEDKNILICEDDLYIPNLFYCNKMLDYAFNVLPRWDVILIAHNTHNSEDTKYVTENNEKIIKIKHSATTAGYLIKKSYIPDLLEIYKRDYAEYLKNKKFIQEYCVDVSWVSLQQTGDWYAFIPRTASQRDSYSDIQKGFIATGGNW